MALVKFYRGLKQNYNAETHIDGLYFALDTKEILVNGDAYGYNPGDHQEIESVDYTAPDTIVITYTNGESDTVTLQQAQAGDSVENSKAGIISKEDIHKLSQIESGAQVNIIEKVKVNGTPLSVNEKEVNIDLSGIESTIEKNKIVAGDTSVTVVEGSTAGGSTTPTTVAVKIKSGGAINLTPEGIDVDKSALEKYTGDGKAVVVDESADSNNQKKISLNLNSKAGNILSATADGLFASVRLKAMDVSPEETTVASRYGLVGITPDGQEINVGDVTIDIMKDKFLKNVELGTIPVGQPSAGDDALIFTFLLADGTESVKYVNVSTFLREAEAGDGIQFITGSDGVKRYTIKIDTAASEKNSSSVGYLQLTADGLKLVGINAEIEALKTLIKTSQTEVVEKSEGFVKVTVTEEADGHSKVTVTEEDIASAKALEELTKRVEDLEDKRELSDYWSEPDSEEFEEPEDNDWNLANPDDWAEIED